MDNLREEFIKDREERYNGKLSFISFAKYIGRSDENVIYNLSGLIYVINRVVYFEDFEKPPSLISAYNSKSYKKFEFNFNLDDITAIKSIKEKDSLECIKQKYNVNSIGESKGFFDNFFNKYVSLVLNANNLGYFFEITDIKNFNLLTS